MKRLICISALCAAPALAAGSETPPSEANRAPGWQPAPANLGEWADRCTDFTVNGWGMKDPKNFLKLLELFSDPSIYLEYARRMQDPETFAHIANQMMDPATARNYMEWSDPVIYTRWMQAFMDPNFYTAAMRPFFDPATMMRWISLPMDQRAWSAGGNMMSPATWMKWAGSGVNPKVMQPLAKAADPNTPMKWLQAVGDPTAFRAWNGWLPVPGANAQGNAPGGGLFPFNLTPWGTAPGANPAAGDARANKP